MYGKKIQKFRSNNPNSFTFDSIQLKRKDKYRNLEYFTWFPLNLSCVPEAWFSSVPNLSEITGVAVKDTKAIQ